MWKAFWQRMGDGDVQGALEYVHSRGRQSIERAQDAGQTPDIERAKDTARQMAFCHLEPDPIPFSREGSRWMYHVECRHGDESAEMYTSVGKDADGEWRLLP
jgi:hypothetical protein